MIIGVIADILTPYPVSVLRTGLHFPEPYFWPGGTEEQFRAMIKVLHPETGLPEGRCSHTSDPTESVYLISVVWDSKKHSEALVQNTLLPALPVDCGFSGVPEERAAQGAHHDSI